MSARARGGCARRLALALAFAREGWPPHPRENRFPRDAPIAEVGIKLASLDPKLRKSLGKFDHDHDGWVR